MKANHNNMFAFKNRSRRALQVHMIITLWSQRSEIKFIGKEHVLSQKRPETAVGVKMPNFTASYWQTREPASWRFTQRGQKWENSHQKLCSKPSQYEKTDSTVDKGGHWYTEIVWTDPNGLSWRGRDGRQWQETAGTHTHRVSHNFSQKNKILNTLKQKKQNIILIY